MNIYIAMLMEIFTSVALQWAINGRVNTKREKDRSQGHSISITLV